LLAGFFKLILYNIFSNRYILLQKYVFSAFTSYNVSNSVTSDLVKKRSYSFYSFIKLPVLINVVQYAPEFFTYVKIQVDRSYKTGVFRFLITIGSLPELIGNIEIIFLIILNIFPIKGIIFPNEYGGDTNG
jgi:hypothetical protein